MTNGNSAEHEPEFIEEWCQQVFKRDHNFPSAVERAAYQEGWQARAAMSVCADGGKGEAVYQIRASRFTPDWTDVSASDARFHDYPDGLRRIVYNAPQAECAPHALPDGWKFESNESDDRIWLTIHHPSGTTVSLSARATYDEGRYPTLCAQVIRDLVATLCAPRASVSSDDAPSMWKGESNASVEWASGWNDCSLSARADAEKDAALTDDDIRRIFMANGFTIKEGHTDLKPYVYAAARAILAARKEPQP